MGYISTDLFNSSISLMERIENSYYVAPQIVVANEFVGFNVHGREAGKVFVDGDKLNGDYYPPGQQPFGPVYVKKVINC